MPAGGSSLTPDMVSGGKQAPGETERGRYIYPGICRRHSGGGEGNGANTASSLAQDALWKVGTWCREVGLSVNPEKTEMVFFTHKRKLDRWNDPLFQGRKVRRKRSISE